MATYESIRYDFPVAAATTSTQVGTGAMTLINTITASSSTTRSFINGSNSTVLDSTYKTYIFKFYDVHPANDFVNLQFQGDIVGDANYNEAITSTAWEANHSETTSTQFQYETARDQAQGSAFQPIAYGVGNGNDES